MAPRLRVSAGPSLDELHLVRVNDEACPTTISSDDFEGRIAVRIQNFTGIRAESNDQNGSTTTTTDAEHASGLETQYFAHGHAKGCTWSIQIQGRFKREVCVDNIEYGNQFERPIRDRLPWGTSVALRALNILDPTLRHDIYCDEPWAFGPLITSMTRVNVQRIDKDSEANVSAWPHFPTGRDDDDYVQDDTSILLCEPSSLSTASEDRLLASVEEQGLADLSTLNQLRDPQHAHSARARLWSNPAVREAVVFRPNDIVTLAFDNAFIDFNTLRAVLPYTGGMGFDLQQYWDGQPVRYFCRHAHSDTVFFVVEFQIVEKDS